MSKNVQVKQLETDILIIGGGTAGCYAALTIREENSNASVLILEKANIKRSGCHYVSWWLNKTWFNKIKLSLFIKIKKTIQK